MREPRRIEVDGDPDVQGELQQTLLTIFCRTLDSSRLPPMTVLGMMAEALGGVYRQAATAHLTQPCPCGWRPMTEADIAALRAAVETAAKLRTSADLAWMEVVGRA
ncbi:MULTISPECIES: hypothetical protein [unclassified Bradyrhizobium]|uniref:hypothetical protein n=1 Tax=unclassified Bradyrhizobium TaxID=2631580 RepID=UPI0020121CA6|nr:MULTISPECIES: hypothetical protein [unclassified Bradyrhizobium]